MPNHQPTTVSPAPGPADYFRREISETECYANTWRRMLRLVGFWFTWGWPLVALVAMTGFLGGVAVSVWLLCRIMDDTIRVSQSFPL